MVLVLYRGGWREREVPDPDLRIEGLLALGAAQHPVEADRIADSQLDLYAVEREEVTVGIEPIDETDCPYLGFNVGDTIELISDEPEPEQIRVVGFAVSEDVNGKITFVPQLKELIFTDQQRRAQAIKKMSNGTFQGDSKVATPAALIDLPKAGPTCCPPVFDEDPG
jgi:hypothetical protein